MSNLVPFGDDLPIPSFARAKATNADLTAHASQGFSTMSIKGKQFAVVTDGIRKALMNPKDPESPATYIEVVLVKSNPNTSKIYYAKGYDPAAGENVKPSCFSNDGVKPDALVATPVSTSCATCPNNVYGAKITENGKKAKLCTDSVRVAIATPDNLSDVLLLRVPPASIKALGDFGANMTKRGVDYRAVVTKISFDPEEATPKLVFRPVQFVDEATFKKIDELSESTIVQRILGMEPSPTAVKATEDMIEKAKEVVKSVSTDKVVAEKEVKAAVEAAKPKPTNTDVSELNIDDIQFDD
jgi:hypothetical protein